MKHLKFIQYSIFLALSLFFSVQVLAAQTPVVMLKNASNQLISDLEKNKANIKNPQVIRQIIERRVLPHFDLDQMAADTTVGQYLKNATPAQRTQFKKVMIGLVIKNYSAPLKSFNGEQVKFAPIRDFSPSKNKVEVKSIIIRKNGQKIPVTYALKKTASGWKVIDFKVEGISMVQSYQSQFKPVLSQGGFPLLLQKLQKSKN